MQKKISFWSIVNSLRKQENKITRNTKKLFKKITKDEREVLKRSTIVEGLKSRKIGNITNCVEKRGSGKNHLEKVKLHKC